MDEKKRDWRKYYNPEVQRRANAKYQKSKTKQIAIQLNISTDADILEHLERIPNKQGYIKSLIREDIQKGGG